MYNVGNRANAIFAYACMVTFSLLFLNVVSSKLFLHPQTPPDVSVSLQKIEGFRKQPGAGNDQVWLLFDLDADLSSLFHWNTKMLFVFISAEYKTKTNVVNQVAIWDRIIQTKAESKLKLSSEQVEYVLSDQGEGLRNNEVNLTVYWNIIPISGLLTQESHGIHSIRIPSNYLQQ